MPKGRKDLLKTVSEGIDVMKILITQANLCVKVIFRSRETKNALKFKCVVITTAEHNNVGLFNMFNKSDI